MLPIKSRLKAQKFYVKNRLKRLHYYKVYRIARRLEGGLTDPFHC